jgi:hypothetical protein
MPEAAASQCESVPSASMNATIAFASASLFLGLSRPELLVLWVDDQDRAGDLGDQLVGKHVVAEGESFTWARRRRSRTCLLSPTRPWPHLPLQDGQDRACQTLAETKIRKQPSPRAGGIHQGQLPARASPERDHDHDHRTAQSRPDARVLPLRPSGYPMHQLGPTQSSRTSPRTRGRRQWIGRHPPGGRCLPYPEPAGPAAAACPGRHDARANAMLASMLPSSSPPGLRRDRR